MRFDFDLSFRNHMNFRNKIFIILLFTSIPFVFCGYGPQWEARIGKRCAFVGAPQKTSRAGVIDGLWRVNLILLREIQNEFSND